MLGVESSLVKTKNRWRGALAQFMLLVPLLYSISTRTKPLSENKAKLEICNNRGRLVKDHNGIVRRGDVYEWVEVLQALWTCIIAFWNATKSAPINILVVCWERVRSK